MDSRGTSWVEAIWGSDIQRRAGDQERFEERVRERQSLDMVRSGAMTPNEARAALRIGHRLDPVDSARLNQLMAEREWLVAEQRHQEAKSIYATLQEYSVGWEQFSKGIIESMRVTYESNAPGPSLSMRLMPPAEAREISNLPPDTYWVHN